ncbi:MAG TPA: hypothetical protein VFQ22_01340 [Longimicrobiales bacterium]|nr:hypothetical protein [Longimicrobiales bacterium]
MKTFASLVLAPVMPVRARLARGGSRRTAPARREGRASLAAVVVLALPALLAGCGGRGLHEPVLVPPPGWEPDAPAAIDDPDEDAEEAARRLEEELDGYGIHASFWPREPERVGELQREGIVVSEGPCGPTVDAWIRSVPREHPVIASERAVELDARGATLTDWPLPLHSVIGGVEGDRILVPLRLDADPASRVPALAIRPDGELDVTAIVPDTHEAVPFECPSIERFGDSDYLRCLIYPDRETGRERRIAYQAPCT